MTILNVLTYFGIFVFALSGAFKARSFKMDIFGGLVLAFVTAYGGGTLRDLLIGNTPVNWINDNLALGLVFGSTIFTFLAKEGINNFQKTILITDAIGLGFFTVVGMEIALSKGLNELYALVMGVITATFGGLIADIISNNLPNLLRRGELYATACAIGAAIYLIMKMANFDHTINLLSCIFITFSIRIFSFKKKIGLPSI